MKIHHQVAINAPPSTVYEAIAEPENIGRWWDEQTTRNTEEGLVLEHNPGPDHGIVRLKVVELVPDKRIDWECISSHPSSSPASVWTGTHFIFEISSDESPASTAVKSCPDLDVEELVTLNFYQTNYPENSGFLGFNNFAWGQVIESLKSYCESQQIDS